MAYRHIENVAVTACFSECGKYRYRLDIKKKGAQRGGRVCAIMQNPSVADAVVADKSAQFLERLIFEKNDAAFRGVEKIVIVNQFAFIQTKGFNGLAERIGPDNDGHIKRALDESDIVLIAWGKGNRYRGRIEAVNRLIQATGRKTLLQTKNHPSRGRYTDFIEPYIVPDASL